MTEHTAVRVIRADYSDRLHAEALVELLDGYARDPMGGGEPLSEFARLNLVGALAQRAQAFSILAFDDLAGKAIGLVNCLEGFSTFACKPLVNVHDVVVASGYRCRGVASAMLALVEQIGRERGACKLTLEVLEGNDAAMRVYRRYGFANYQLASAAGHAQFLQKYLS